MKYRKEYHKLRCRKYFKFCISGASDTCTTIKEYKGGRDNDHDYYYEGYYLIVGNLQFTKCSEFENSTGVWQRGDLIEA